MVHKVLPKKSRDVFARAVCCWLCVFARLVLKQSNFYGPKALVSYYTNELIAILDMEELMHTASDAVGIAATETSFELAKCSGLLH